jgi:hypothetical protein
LKLPYSWNIELLRIYFAIFFQEDGEKKPNLNPFKINEFRNKLIDKKEYEKGW